MSKAAARNTATGEFVTKSSSRSSAVLREPKAGEFVVLKDGRKIVEPPDGGKLRKRDIERAVREVVERRRAASDAN
jgi:hypothetical protein